MISIDDKALMWFKISLQRKNTWFVGFWAPLCRPFSSKQIKMTCTESFEISFNPMNLNFYISLSVVKVKGIWNRKNVSADFSLCWELGYIYT